MFDPGAKALESFARRHTPLSFVEAKRTRRSFKSSLQGSFKRETKGKTKREKKSFKHENLVATEEIHKD
jgi:hypothetical protein